MEPGQINGATRVLFAPKEWNADRDGPCGGLPIREAKLESGAPCMVSAWKPTVEELVRLNAGAPVELCVIGSAHPPIGMSVGLAMNFAEAPDLELARRRIVRITNEAETRGNVHPDDVIWLIELAAKVLHR